MKPLKVIFFGTPFFAVPFLEALLKHPSFSLQAVITQPDRPAGRHGLLTASPVKIFAQKNNLPIWQPVTLKNQETIERFKNFQADLFIVVAYGRIIPKEILSAPRLGCLNVHPSLLPRYRGPSPIQMVILNGDKITGLTFMLLDEGVDTGPILRQTEFSIEERDTSETLSARISHIGAPLLAEVVQDYADGKLFPSPQPMTDEPPTRQLRRADGKIDWSQSPVQIERQIRAFAPWPGAFIEHQHGRRSILVKILKAQLTSNGRLEILTVQPAGRAAMNYQEFVRGYGKIAGC